MSPHSPKETPLELARILEREAGCEDCKARPATTICDGFFVCDDCRRARWLKYWQEVMVRGKRA